MAGDLKFCCYSASN